MMTTVSPYRKPRSIRQEDKSTIFFVLSLKRRSFVLCAKTRHYPIWTRVFPLVFVSLLQMACVSFRLYLDPRLSFLIIFSFILPLTLSICQSDTLAPCDELTTF